MKYLASLSFIMFGTWLIIDHKLNTGATWDWSTIWQPWHHEGLAGWSILIGIGVIIWSLKYKR